MCGAFFKRMQQILTAEGVEFDKKVVAEFITKNYPDWRKVLNELQRYSSNGKIDSGILSDITGDQIAILFDLLQAKNFSGMRKWVSDNNDLEPHVVFRKIYDMADVVVDKKAIPLLVLIIAKYQYQHAFVADKEINLAAALTEIMGECF
jgi:DNA polymerase III delta prime subunit